MFTLMHNVTVSVRYMSVFGVYRQSIECLLMLYAIEMWKFPLCFVFSVLYAPFAMINLHLKSED